VALEKPQGDHRMALAAAPAAICKSFLSRPAPVSRQIHGTASSSNCTDYEPYTAAKKREK